MKIRHDLKRFQLEAVCLFRKMNPLTNVKSLNKLNDRELQLGTVGTAGSWHKQYRSSAWVFFGGMPYELTEGDIICVFSQYGEVVNINLVRDKKTGKSKGFGFICYEDQRSTDLAVDNFNGSTLLGRTIRIDHVLNYKPPKDNDDEADIISEFLKNKGCAPDVIQGKLKELNDSNKISVKKEKLSSKKDDDSDDLDVQRRRTAPSYRKRSPTPERKNESKRAKDDSVKIKKEPMDESDESRKHKKSKKKESRRSRSRSRSREKYRDHRSNDDRDRRHSHHRHH